MSFPLLRIICGDQKAQPLLRHGSDTIDILRIAGDPDPTVTASVSGIDTTVHIA